MTTEVHLDDKLVRQGLALTGLNRPEELAELALQELVARRAATAGGADARDEQAAGRQPGSARGKLRVLSDDDDHLADFGDYMP